MNVTLKKLPLIVLFFLYFAEVTLAIDGLQCTVKVDCTSKDNTKFVFSTLKTNEIVIEKPELLVLGGGAAVANPEFKTFQTKFGSGGDIGVLPIIAPELELVFTNLLQNNPEAYAALKSELEKVNSGNGGLFTRNLGMMFDNITGKVLFEEAARGTWKWKSLSPTTPLVGSTMEDFLKNYQDGSLSDIKTQQLDLAIGGIMELEQNDGFSLGQPVWIYPESE